MKKKSVRDKQLAFELIIRKVMYCEYIFSFILTFCEILTRANVLQGAMNE